MTTFIKPVKMSLPDCEEFNIKFIQLVQANKCLYDVTIPEYSSKEDQDKSWGHIAQTCSASVSECKARWRHLRGSLTRYMKKLRASHFQGGDGCCRQRQCKPFYLWDKMQFVVPYLKQRNRLVVVGVGVGGGHHSSSYSSPSSSSHSHSHHHSQTVVSAAASHSHHLFKFKQEAEEDNEIEEEEGLLVDEIEAAEGGEGVEGVDDYDEEDTEETGADGLIYEEVGATTVMEVTAEEGHHHHVLPPAATGHSSADPAAILLSTTTPPSSGVGGGSRAGASRKRKQTAATATTAIPATSSSSLDDSLERPSLSLPDYFQNKKSVTVISSDNPDLDFFRSILPDMANFTPSQKRTFKIRVLELLEDISNE